MPGTEPNTPTGRDTAQTLRPRTPSPQRGRRTPAQPRRGPSPSQPGEHHAPCNHRDARPFTTRGHHGARNRADARPPGTQANTTLPATTGTPIASGPADTTDLAQPRRHHAPRNHADARLPYNAGRPTIRSDHGDTTDLPQPRDTTTARTPRPSQPAHARLSCVLQSCVRQTPRQSRGHQTPSRPAEVSTPRNPATPGSISATPPAGHHRRPGKPRPRPTARAAQICCHLPRTPQSSPTPPARTKSARCLPRRADASHHVDTGISRTFARSAFRKAFPASSQSSENAFTCRAGARRDHCPRFSTDLDTLSTLPSKRRRSASPSIRDESICASRQRTGRQFAGLPSIGGGRLLDGAAARGRQFVIFLLAGRPDPRSPAGRIRAQVRQLSPRPTESPVARGPARLGEIPQRKTAVSRVPSQWLPA
jgi:hypothetical protein